TYDFLVIGAGPAGEAAAMAATKSGLKVGVVDDTGSLGGNCTHKGTIPSKSIRHAVKQVIHYRQQPEVLQMASLPPISYPTILSSAKKIIPRKVAMHKSYFMRNRIYVHSGTAYFAGPNQVNVQLPYGVMDRITAKSVLIAT